MTDQTEIQTRAMPRAGTRGGAARPRGAVQGTAHSQARARAAAGYQPEVSVLSGPRLLAGIEAGPGLAAHRSRWPALQQHSVDDLLGLLRAAHIHGRGGAGFPFARKLETAEASGRRRAVVVNASEGEPASAKDSALMLTTPHLVLDGAEVVARALGVRTVHVVVPGERPAVRYSAEQAIEERSHGQGHLRYQLYSTSGGFVGGQARAVIELIEGRPNLPVTAWQPEAVSGIKGRPTLLSNAETFAQMAALAALGPAAFRSEGTDDEPGTTLLTVGGDGPGGVVLEVGLGASLSAVLTYCGFSPEAPVLMGGYHGAWLAPHQVAGLVMTRSSLASVGCTLGAGIVLPLEPGTCPVSVTARIVEYLASQSAKRCGPCRFGLPALARATTHLARRGGVEAAERVQEVAGIVTGRGACAHPDGTSRLVRSMLAMFGDEVASHSRGVCSAASGAWA